MFALKFVPNIYDDWTVSNLIGWLIMAANQDLQSWLIVNCWNELQNKHWNFATNIWSDFSKANCNREQHCLTWKSYIFTWDCWKRGINHKIASNHWQSNQINFGITSWIFFEKTQMCSIYREKLKCPRFIEKNPNVLDLSRKQQTSSTYCENSNVLDLSRKPKCPRFIEKTQMSSIYRENSNVLDLSRKTQMSSIYRENPNVLDISWKFKCTRFIEKKPKCPRFIEKTQISSNYRENPNVLNLSRKPKYPWFIEKTQISSTYRENSNVLDLSRKPKCSRFIEKTQMFSIYREKPKCPRFIKKFQMSLVNQ